MPQILYFVPKMNLLGCTAGFKQFAHFTSHQQRNARTKRNLIVNVKSKQNVALDQRDESKQWA